MRSTVAALRIKPTHVSALVNRAQLMLRNGDVNLALADCAAAQKVNSDFADAHWVEALSALTVGDLLRGFEKYEWRTRLGRAQKPHYAFPAWTGEQNISGCKLLLYAEQGFGDAIQFVRYAALMATRGADVVLAVPKELEALFRAVPGVRDVVAFGDAITSADFQCSLMSLPHLLKTTLDSIPARVPYLAADPGLIEQWRSRVEAIPGKRIGLVWAGRGTTPAERQRSIPPEALAPLLDTGASLLSLQKECRDQDRAWLAAHPEVHDVSADLATFADTAAVVSLLDAVVSIDTAAAHLAGALGKPLHVALPSFADWRWLRDRSDSPWYPTAKLYRQAAAGEWNGVMGAIALNLAQH